MSEKLCALRKIGGGTELKETVLWTNPNPSATFGETTVTLSQSISNFDYIEVEWAEKTNALANKATLMIQVDEFAKFLNPNSNQHIVGVSMLARATGRIHLRFIAKSTNLNVIFSQAYAVNDSSIDNTMTIPLNIYGVKM